MPAIVDNTAAGGNTISDRELLLKALSMGQMISEMRQEINDLRQMVGRMAQGAPMQVEQPSVVSPSYSAEIDWMSPVVHCTSHRVLALR